MSSPLRPLLSPPELPRLRLFPPPAVGGEEEDQEHRPDSLPPSAAPVLPCRRDPSVVRSTSRLDIRRWGEELAGWSGKRTKTMQRDTNICGEDKKGETRVATGLDALFSGIGSGSSVPSTSPRAPSTSLEGLRVLFSIDLGFETGERGTG